jgi:hypothetical protein
MPDTRTTSERVVGVYVRVRDYILLSGIGGGMDEDLRPLYGTLRVRGGADAVFETNRSRFKGPWWVGGWVDLICQDDETM